MTRVVIVEDEEKNASVLKRILATECSGVEIVGAATSIEEAQQAIKQVHPDLIFLDIEMPGGTGFDLLEKCKPLSFEVIFVTAYHQYAIQAFKYNSIDYLLKPIDADELVSAVERAKARIQNQTVNNNLLNFLQTFNTHTTPNTLAKIGLPTHEGYIFVAPEKIIRCEADGAYTHLYMTTHEKMTISKNLKELEEIMDPHFFCRVHHSHLINMHFVKKYRRGKGGYLELEDGTAIEVSSRKKNDFLEKCRLMQPAPVKQKWF